MLTRLNYAYQTIVVHLMPEEISKMLAESHAMKTGFLK